MHPAVYVLATLGETPWILPELLWWLVCQERRPLAGIEVWTTVPGERLIRDLIDSPLWTELQDATGPLPPLAPAGRAPALFPGLRIHVVHTDGEPLHDVRSAREAEAVSSSLYDRVRDLRAGLDESITLVGCLSGGRKTVSAALHTAMVMQARSRDRLVHLLQNQRLETWLRTHSPRWQYAFPTEAWAEATGVPMSEQLSLYDVPFPRLRCIDPRRLQEALTDSPYAEVWSRLNARLETDATATLSRTGISSWTLVIEGKGINRVTEPLTGRLGAVLAAMASLPPGASTDQVLDWLDANNVGWAPSNTRGNDRKTRRRSLRGAASTMRTKLMEVLPPGLERFIPEHEAYAVPGWTVDNQWR